MRRIAFLSALLLVTACATPEAEADAGDSSSQSDLEGVFEYTDGVIGQSIMTGGHYVFLYGPADGSGPMTSHAGTYVIADGVVTHTIKYHTDPGQVGDVFSWRLESTSGDTIAYVVMDEAGEPTGRGRSIRVQ
jgi:hypothetical protein